MINMLGNHTSVQCTPPLASGHHSDLAEKATGSGRKREVGQILRSGDEKTRGAGMVRKDCGGSLHRSGDLLQVWHGSHHFDFLVLHLFRF